MNNQNKLNNNFIDLLELDLNEFKNKIAQDYSQKVTETNDIRIKHSEISKLALKNIEKVDFRGETGLNDENEKLFFKDYLVTCCDKVLETVENCGFSICNSRDNIYLFNGEYWKRASNHKFSSFLGASAYKMGVDKNTSKLYTFREQLLKQLLSVADMYDNVDNGDDENGDKILINLRNGTFEIDGFNMRLKKPEKEDFLTYQLPFDYDENAQCPIFDDYLNTVLPDVNIQKVLMEFLGYLFVKTRVLKLEKALLLYGSGANGKSVLFEIINALLGGSINVSNYSLQNLTNENGYYRAMLGNKIVNYASEINGKMDVSVFKQLVSGEPVDARLPYGEPFTVTNYGKLIFNCNELPNKVEHSHAFFRRFLIIPFEVTIPEEKQDKQLAEKIIKNELSGVLNRILEGLNRLVRQKNFTQCNAINDILNIYKRQSDTVALFIDEEGYEKSAVENITVTNLYYEYKDFCINGSYNPVSKRTFTERLRSLGIIIERIRTGLIVCIKKRSC